MGTQKGAKKSEKKLVKKVKKYNPDKVELTPAEEKLLKENKQTLQRILTPLQQLQANVEANIEAIGTATEVRQFLRSLVGVRSGSPNNIYCNSRHQQLDICICEYLCEAKCIKYLSGRFMCRSFGCSVEVREECETKEHKCNTYMAFKNFAYKYVVAYYPLFKLRNTNDNILDEVPKVIENKPKKKKKKKKKIAVT